MRVLIVEDNVLLARGLRLMINMEGFEVVAAVDTAEAFLDAVDQHAPDVAVVDVRLPPAYRDEGVRAAIEARRRRPGFPILVLSQYVERTYAAELFAQGGRGMGYLLKDRVSRVSDFIDALTRVAAGGTAIDPEVVAELLNRHRPPGPIDRLSPRERQVLGLMAEGYSNTAIAERLGLTERSISKNIGSIFTKLDLGVDDSVHRRVLAVLAFLGG